jgi:transcriptional activator of cad operon
VLKVGEWHADRGTSTLKGPAGEHRLEPKVMDLLFLLAGAPGKVFSREQILEILWPGLIVGDDALARTVSKLRQALGDDAKAPRYIETISKRGYRLLVDVVPVVGPVAGPVVGPHEPADGLAGKVTAARWMRVGVVLAMLMVVIVFVIPAHLRNAPARHAREAAASDEHFSLIARADDAYFQFSRGDNEAAIELYRRVLALRPDDVPALAGLANALTQRSIRWPDPRPGEDPTEFTQLRDALAHGHLDRPQTRQQLQRARQLAERAIALAPDSAAAHKALGFVAGAQREFEPALVSYRRAVTLDPDAWGAMINIGDVLEITARKDAALPWFEQAFAAMARSYDRNPAQIRPWHARLGVAIAERYRDRGQLPTAEAWYRKVLTQTPLHPDATRGLAMLLHAGGDLAEANRLCNELVQRLGPAQGCALRRP